MAGAGAKLFTSGSVLTADQVNTFLMDQSIMRFASTTTRDAAFGGAGEPTLAEGMFAYTTDTNTLWLYNGSSWVNLLGSDIGEQALSNRNVIINGAMQIAQRGTSAVSVNGTGYQTADRFLMVAATAGTYTQSVENDAPTGSGLRKSLKMLVTTANASLSAGSINYIVQELEGQNVQQFLKGTSSAKQFAFSFWVKSNVTGTYICELFDRDNTRTVSASYTVNASATWEKKTITFPADTTGVFDNDNASSMFASFWLVAGSNFASGTLNTTWAANTNANRAVGQTNLASAINNYWQITGVQLEAGAVATPFEFEQYSETLAKCQRYYYRTGGSSSFERYGMGVGSSSTVAYAFVSLPVTMRAAPSSLESNQLNTYDGGGGPASLTSVTINQSGKDGVDLALGAASGWTQYRPIALHANNTLSSYIAFSAEL